MLGAREGGGGQTMSAWMRRRGRGRAHVGLALPRLHLALTLLGTAMTTPEWRVTARLAPHRSKAAGFRIGEATLKAACRWRCGTPQLAWRKGRLRPNVRPAMNAGQAGASHSAMADAMQGRAVAGAPGRASFSELHGVGMTSAAVKEQATHASRPKMTRPIATARGGRGCVCLLPGGGRSGSVRSPLGSLPPM